MHKVTFFPIGNADCCRIDLDCGEKILFDYANARDADDDGDKRIDLPTELREDLEGADCDHYAAVAFTHLDTDHIQGATEFFHLEHAKKYQGGDRIKMPLMWVPAAAITDSDVSGEAGILRREAQHRLREGKGIRVFSRPAALKDWLESQGLTLEDRQHLITDAGRLVPDFSLDEHAVEFFVHSPFAHRQDENTVVDRNSDSIIVQATFAYGGENTHLLLPADADHEDLSHIVQITRSKGNAHRLEWDVCKLPHHCSYLALAPDKGTTQTTPVPDVQWLFEDQARERPIIVSTSDSVPSTDTEQPPHRQAAKYYRSKVVSDPDRDFIPTMDHPSPTSPRPLVVLIDSRGATVERKRQSGRGSAVAAPAPRAG